jgi:putative hydrolase of the HAD superfamily
MGLKLGIISNTSSMNFVSIRLLQEDLLKYFDTNCIFLSSSSGMKKPNPIIFQVACRDIGVKFNEIAYVGDTLDKDVNASRKAGFKLSIRIAIDRADIISQGKEADYVIKKLTEIPNIITKVNKK